MKAMILPLIDIPAAYGKAAQLVLELRHKGMHCHLQASVAFHPLEDESCQERRERTNRNQSAASASIRQL